MAEYINRIAYCKEYCHCHSGECNKASCPIFRLPAADVAPVVHGRWQNTYCAYRCSECGRGSAIMTNFCPECGALMSRAQNSKETAHASD